MDIGQQKKFHRRKDKYKKGEGKTSEWWERCKTVGVEAGNSRLIGASVGVLVKNSSHVL